MALLQNDKAIFYHPLNNSTESLQSQAWTESTPTYAAGKVSDALFGTSGTAPAFGTETEFESAGGTAYEALAILSATKFVVAYTDQADGDHGHARVGTVSGTDITFGAVAEINGLTQGTLWQAVGLSASTFVISYADGGSNGAAKVGAVSGTTITFGSQRGFTASMSIDAGLAVLDSSTLVICYVDGADASHGTAKVATVSGLDITYGAETEFLSANGAYYLSAAALDSTKFVVVYKDTSDANHGTAKVGTVSGTDITFGAETEFLSTGAANYNFAASLSTTVFVVAYSDGADASHGTAKVGTVSGTDITFGPETEFMSGSGGILYPSIASLDSTRFIISYYDGSDSGHGTSKVGTVSGTDITFAAESEFLSANYAGYTVVRILSSSKFVVVYADENDSGHGTAKVGSLSSGASLTASTPGAYDTAVAATKVAFAGWLKNPSA